MLALLLDENISYAVADQVLSHRPDIPIVSIHHFEEGRLRSADDDVIIRAASEARLTLVTYDVTTIPPLLQHMAAEGCSHSGIIFIDRRAIPSNEFGRLVRSIIRYWENEKENEWTNRIVFLPTL